MNRLYYPWMLAAAAVVPLIWWSWLSRRRWPAIRFAGVTRLPGVGGRWSMRARHVLPALRTLAVLLLVVCLARPQRADEMTRVRTEGVAIDLVLDRSGSMDADDFRDERGGKMRRLDAVKDVVKRFLLGDGEDLRGRPDDLVGLIVFARYPDTECPLTTDHAHLLRALESVEIPKTREENFTAIGDALMLAVERIKNVGRRLGGTGEALEIKSRVIVLLTDGEQNAGEFDPVQAAEAAAAYGVKVYTIGAAPEYTEQEFGLPFGLPTIRQPTRIDEEQLRKVAETTGGRYFRARDAAALAGVYAEIDRLERSVIDEQRYEVYEELATRWIDAGPVRLPPPLLVVLALLAVELVLANTRFRAIP